MGCNQSQTREYHFNCFKHRVEVTVSKMPTSDPDPDSDLESDSEWDHPPPIPEIGMAYGLKKEGGSNVYYVNEVDPEKKQILLLHTSDFLLRHFLDSPIKYDEKKVGEGKAEEDPMFWIKYNSRGFRRKFEMYPHFRIYPKGKKPTGSKPFIPAKDPEYPVGTTVVYKPKIKDTPEHSSSRTTKLGTVSRVFLQSESLYQPVRPMNVYRVTPLSSGEPDPCLYLEDQLSYPNIIRSPAGTSRK